MPVFICTPPTVRTRYIHRYQLKIGLAVETAATQKEHLLKAGFKEFDFSLVRAGGVCSYSSDFHSPRLQLTPMVIL